MSVLFRSSCAAVLLLVGATSVRGVELVDLADPLVGTDNTREVSNGNLYPAIARPWGMNAWTPQTRPAGSPWIYDYKDGTICGFHQTHQPSPWLGDYAQFSVMPIVGRAGFGQYAHGNQPVQHMIYLYDLIGRHDKAAYWAHEVMNRLYKVTPDGYCGDEDNGQTSAWFVWSAMGKYPLLPVGDEYAEGKPLFDRVEIRRPSGTVRWK